MKELETEFAGRGEVKGFTFKQIDRTDDAYLYEITGSGLKHYEVFERRENSQFGTISYPSAKAFGIWAYTAHNLNAATILMQTLDQRVKSRKTANGNANTATLK